MIDLNKAKNYLQIDFEDDDDIIKMLIDSSYIFLENSVGKNFREEENSLADLFCLALIKDCYDNRNLNINKSGEKLKLVYNSILLQLTYCPVKKEWWE